MKPWVIKARSFARKAGVLGCIQRFRRGGPYEKRVREVLIAAVKPGDVVWDVGAHYGFYSEMFSQQVGEDGLVVAFEPSADSCSQIRERLANCAWLRVENVALGDTDTTGRLVMGTRSVLNHIEIGRASADAASNSIPVEICRGDTACERLGRTPNVIKVDVEGFEEEVLEGMGGILRSSALRSILVEVHFRELELRGRAMAPNRIEKLLCANGFRTKWVGTSHLLATR